MKSSTAVNTLYYSIKPLLPRSLQIWMRRILVRQKRQVSRAVWPILEKAAVTPQKWPGWPDKKKFALVLTHDVDTQRGHDRCRKLMGMEKTLGFRSSFNFVPERYNVSSSLRTHLTENGFEVGVHGLKHDGKLFQSRQAFLERALRINHYISEWKAAGFRAPAMHHNLEWISELNIEYDLSTFDTDPFEPQPTGMETIFPFVFKSESGRKYVEMPYTLPQDFTLFVLMEESNIEIWTKKLDWIAAKGGMALINTHPDYMSFSETGPGLEEYPVKYYSEFLEYAAQRYGDQFWHALPREVAAHTRLAREV